MKNKTYKYLNKTKQANSVRVYITCVICAYKIMVRNSNEKPHGEYGISCRKKKSCGGWIRGNK